MNSKSRCSLSLELFSCRTLIPHNKIVSISFPGFKLGCFSQNISEFINNDTNIFFPKLYISISSFPFLV